MNQNNRFLYHYHLDKNKGWCKDKYKLRVGDIDEDKVNVSYYIYGNKPCCKYVVSPYGEYFINNKTYIKTYPKKYYNISSSVIDNWELFDIERKFYTLDDINLKDFINMIAIDEIFYSIDKLNNDLSYLYTEIADCKECYKQKLNDIRKLKQKLKEM